MTFAGAVPGPDGQPFDQIRLTGVSATGHHGVLAHERTGGQLFRADVVLHVDSRAAASSDDLRETVSYADVAQDVYDVLAGPPVDLIETVAERIAAAALDYAAVQAVDVRVHKPQAPIQVPFDDVEVVIRRDRERAPVVEPRPGGAHGTGVGAPFEDLAPRPDRQDAAAQAAPVSQPAFAADAEPVYVPVEVPAMGDTTAGSFGMAPAPVAPAVEPAAAPTSGPVPGAVPPQEAEPAPPQAPEAEAEPPVHPLDAEPEGPVEVVIALGANLGEAQATLRTAVTDIDRIPGLQVTEVSPLARTAAVGGPEQPDFLNAVLIARTTLSPHDLLRACQAVEAQHGRVRHEQWGPRTLDVDIIQYGTLTASSDDLELPHPRARERAFVLVPWAEVAPHAVLVGLGGGPVTQLAATAPDRTGIRWLALDWLTDTAAPAPAAAAPASAPTPAHATSTQGTPMQGTPMQDSSVQDSSGQGSSTQGPPPPPAPPVPPAPVQPQQAAPPAVPPTPPHGVAPAAPPYAIPPAEPAYLPPQVHEPIPPAPQQQLLPAPEQQHFLPTSEQQLLPAPDLAPPAEQPRMLISDVPFEGPASLPFRPIVEVSEPLPVRPTADEPFPVAPVSQPFRPASDGGFSVPPLPPLPTQPDAQPVQHVQQPFRPVSEGTFESPAVPPSYLPPLDEHFAMPPAQPSYLPPSDAHPQAPVQQPFPPLTDGPLQAPAHPFPTAMDDPYPGLPDHPFPPTGPVVRRDDSR